MKRKSGVECSEKSLRQLSRFVNIPAIFALKWPGLPHWLAQVKIDSQRQRMQQRPGSCTPALQKEQSTGDATRGQTAAKVRPRDLQWTTGIG
jgi:hypothetical protein